MSFVEKVRRVRTPAGVKHFGLPMGSPIHPGRVDGRNKTGYYPSRSKREQLVEYDDDGHLSPDSVERIEGMFTIFFDDGKYFTEVTDVREAAIYKGDGEYRPVVTVEGRLVGSDDDYVGHWTRWIDTENGEVHHDLLSVNPDNQAAGIGASFVKASFVTYRDYGFSHVTLEADIDIGGYAWATMGFSFDEDRQIHSRSGLYKRIKMVADGSYHEPTSDTTRRHAQKIINQIDKGIHPPVQEIAVLGRKDTAGRRKPFTWNDTWRRGVDAREVTTWVGKDILLGANWYGRYDLTSDDIWKSAAKPDPMLDRYIKWLETVDKATWNKDDARPSHDPENHPNGDYDLWWPLLGDDSSLWDNHDIEKGYDMTDEEFASFIGEEIEKGMGKPHAFKDSDESGTCDICDGKEEDESHDVVGKQSLLEKIVALFRDDTAKSHEEDEDADTVPQVTSDTHMEDYMPEINKDDLPDEVKALLDAKDQEIADLKAASVTEERDTEKAAQDALLSKADPALVAIIKQAQDAATAAMQEASIAKAAAEVEKAARVRQVMVAKAHEYKNIAGSPDEKADLLTKAYDVSDEFGKSLEQSWKAANAQLDAPGFLAPVGKSGAETTVSKEVEAKVSALRETDQSLTYEQAFDRVLVENPSLYDQIEEV